MEVKCPICQDKHKLDNYNWVDSCEGYMPLVDFEMLIKLEMGESVEYV